MHDVVGELIPYAVAVALTPLPLIAVLLLLLSPGGRAAGTALLAGRALAIVVVVAVFSFLAESVPESNGTSLLSALIRILLGVALIAFAVVKIVRRPRSDGEAKLPNWMAAIEGMSPWPAARLGVLLSVVNVKELAFGFGAGLIVGVAGLGVGQTVVVVAVYAAIACLSVAVPVVGFVLAGDRAIAPLTSARTWLVRNNTVVLGVVLLVIGAILIGNGVTAV